MRARIYDLLFHRLSKGWYQEVLKRQLEGTKLLDIGVGTGSSLLSNGTLLREKKLAVTGIDINGTYLNAARRRAVAEALEDYVTLEERSVYDLEGVRFDTAYFSASFMLLPDQRRALDVVSQQLAAGGKIYFTQTFEKRRNRAMEVLKPLLYKLTTVHFGVVTYEAPFLELLRDAGLEVIENKVLSAGLRREIRLIAAMTPHAAAAATQG